MNVKESCDNSSLEYAELPSRDYSIFSSVDVVLDSGLPLPQKIDNLQLKFFLPEGENQFVDGIQMFLRNRFQVLKEDKSKFMEDLNIAPIVGLGSTAIKQMSLWNAGRPLITWDNYGTMLHPLYLLHKPKNWWGTLGVNGGWIPDDKTPFIDEAFAAEDTGIKKRRELISKSRVFELAEPLMIPPLFQEKLIPNSNQQWCIQMQMNTSDFLMMKQSDVTEKPVLYLLKSELVLTKLNLTPPALDKVARTPTLTIPFVDYGLQTFSFPAGVLEKQFPQTTLPQTPKRLYFFFLTQKQLTGTLDSNPMVYLPHRLETLQVEINDEIYKVSNLHFTDGREKLFSTGYWNTFFRGLQKQDGDTLVTVDDWSSMYCVHVFDVTPNRMSSECNFLTAPYGHPVAYRTYVKLREAAADPLHMMVIAESERVVTCNQKEGSVIVV